MEEEMDAFGLRAVRMTMIPYYLNRKLVQDSKYAMGLLFDLVMELSASERTRARMDNMVCVNKNGKPGEGIFRDKANEHIIREAKQSMNSLHGNLKDLNLEKNITSLSIVNQVTAHDKVSMLDGSSSSRSYDHIGDERREAIAKELFKVNPFSKDRSKIDFFDKSKGSPFTGMDLPSLERFMKRNRDKFRKQQLI